MFRVRVDEFQGLAYLSLCAIYLLFFPSYLSLDGDESDCMKKEAA